MARLPRLTVAGLPHLVLQRGNDRRAIFVDDSDRERYVEILREIAASIGLAVHAYVLMPDHVHLLATPQAAGDVGRAVQALGRRYVRWFNHRHGRVGTLFEGRYRSTVLDAGEFLVAAMRYIESNPVRAGLVDQPGEFRWSSHRHHVGQCVDPLVSDHAVYWALGNTPFERQAAYRGLFEHGAIAQEIDAIRRATHGGWLLGSSKAAAQLSTGRRAVPRKAGRPRRPPHDSVPE